MRREDDLLADSVGVIVAKLAHEFEGEESCMSFVQVEGVNVHVAESTEHSQAADSQNELLAEPVTVVSAVKVPAEFAVIGMVRLEVRIKEVNGKRIAGDAYALVHPHADLNLAALNRNADLVGQEGKLFRRVPHYGLLFLPVVLVELLNEIALSVEEGNTCHRNAEICGTLEDVARQNAESS